MRNSVPLCDAVTCNRSLHILKSSAPTGDADFIGEGPIIRDSAGAAGSRCANQTFEIIQHLLEFSQRMGVVIGNLGEVSESLLQPRIEGSHCRRRAAAASDKPVNAISQPAASTVTRGSARPP